MLTGRVIFSLTSCCNHLFLIFALKYHRRGPARRGPARPGPARGCSRPITLRPASRITLRLYEGRDRGPARPRLASPRHALMLTPVIAPFHRLASATQIVARLSQLPLGEACPQLITLWQRLYKKTGIVIAKSQQRSCFDESDDQKRSARAYRRIPSSRSPNSLQQDP